MKFITVPAGRFAAEEDAAAAKRREIAERLKRGESVNVNWHKEDNDGWILLV